MTDQFESMTEKEFMQLVTDIIEFTSTKKCHKIGKSAALRACASILDSMAQAEMGMAAIMRYLHESEGSVQ